MVRGLSTREINDYLNPRVKEFVGTFPRDLLPDTRRRPTALIVNTDTSDGEGIHWNAIVLLKGGYGEYFNSLGLPPLQREIQEYMSFTCPNGYKYNFQVLQHPYSPFCGVYCIDYIVSRFEKGESMREYLRHFKQDLEANDKLVVRRVFRWNV